MTQSKPRFVKRDMIVGGPEYIRLLNSLKERFRRSQIKAAVKVNVAMLEFYWDMGRDICRLHAMSQWGSAFFDCLSLDLKAEFPEHTGFSVTNLKYIKRWYEFYNQESINRRQPIDEIRHQVGDELEMPVDFGMIPWKHHVWIFSHCKSVPEAFFYIEKTIQNGWSRSELATEIDANLYDKQGNAVTNFEEKLPAPYSGLAKAILKSPYDFGFIDKKITSEQQLEDELAGNITRFLLELGQGFAYVGRQIELTMPGGQSFIPDMVFYHTRLKCYIVLELKVIPFMPEFAGKLNFYVSAVDELMKQPDDNPTIGLLICKSKDDTVVEWTFRGIERPIGVAEYQLQKTISEEVAKLLPSEKEIQRMLDTYGKE